MHIKGTDSANACSLNVISQTDLDIFMDPNLSFTHDYHVASHLSHFKRQDISIEEMIDTCLNKYCPVEQIKILNYKCC